MPANSYQCEDERRRSQVRLNPDLNGIDYLEVSEDHLSLRIFFLDKAPAGVTIENIRIEGGVRTTGIKAIEIRFCRQAADDRDDCMEVRVDKPGDFSTYRLCLVEPCMTADGGKNWRPFRDFDPRYACLDFRFCTEGTGDLDCRENPPCPPVPRNEPEIDYLAKDYGSFRRLMLDRLRVIMPDWSEYHATDLGIALVEILAYAGDRLSYFQDAVATEAYLATARQRISVHRHVRLIDYRMHEGCNARVFVQVFTAMEKAELNLAEFAFLTRLADPTLADENVLSWSQLALTPSDAYDVFQPISLDDATSVTLYQAHNQINFYTWGDRECCIPKGATSATLLDSKPVASAPVPPVVQQRYQPPPPPNCPPEPPPLPDCQEPERDETGLHLKAGDILIFQEVVGPHSGLPSDADPSHRHAVRLTEVSRRIDKLYNQEIVNIAWSKQDALPFPLCLSSTTDGAHGCKPLPFVSVALGNILLTDHGRSQNETLPLPKVDAQEPACDSAFHPADPVITIKPFDPKLSYGPLTFTTGVAANASAAALMLQDPKEAAPSVEIQNWESRPDLLESGPSDRHFTVEMDNRAMAHLRFGNGVLGKQPPLTPALKAAYRTGNGPAGNIGAGLGPGNRGPGIGHIVFDSRQSGLNVIPWNPLPGAGGIPPEPIEDVKRCAPQGYRQTLERAITSDDYSALANVDPRIQRSATRLAWGGSWYEAEVAIDPLESIREPERTNLPIAIDLHLERYRRMGHDLRVEFGETVPLNVEILACVADGYLAGHVKAALRKRLRAFFQADNLTFGQDIAVSRLIAETMSVEGIASASVTALEPKFAPSGDALKSGVLRMSPWEIARLDSDPSRPENGVLNLVMRGGR